MTEPASERAIASAHGTYLVQGIDRFAIGGDLDAEIVAAVEAHVARHGQAPGAVAWDDAVLAYRPYNGWFGLTRVFVPAGDPFIAAALDSTGRVAVRSDLLQPGARATHAALAGLSADKVAHAGELVRLIGWSHEAPMIDTAPPRPLGRAASVSVIVNYRDKADTTIAALHHLRRQDHAATLEILLVDNQSAPDQRRMVEEAAARLFDGAPDASIRHLSFDEPFNHSRQCNRGATAASGDVLVMLSNDCNLLGTDTLQTLADWALEPGVGAVGPGLVGDDGEIACAGIAIGPRTPGGADLRIHEAELAYLSGIVRQSNGASFACAAVAHDTWTRLGGADEARYPIDYNDADFCLRASEAGLTNLYIGTVRAHHEAGLSDMRTRAGTEQLHAELAAQHALDQKPRRNPTALPIKAYPRFAVPEAEVLCDLVRLYRRALDARDTGQPLSTEVITAFDQLNEIAHRREAGSAAREQAIDAGLRAVAGAFADTAAAEQVPQRYRNAFAVLPWATATLAAMRARPIPDLPQPVEAHVAALAEDRAEEDAPIPVARSFAGALDDPDAAGQFRSHYDPGLPNAGTRLLVFADAMGASQQILFLQGLQQARGEGRCAVAIVSEDDLQRLHAFRGPHEVEPWLRALIGHVRPSAIIFSRFADQAAHRAIRAAAAGLDCAWLCHLDDDFFTLPAVIGVDRYREARHPRRIHGLSAIADEADLLLASTPLLGERLGGLFGMGKIGLCPMHEGGVPAPHQPAADPPVIGYFGSATHNRDLAMIAPALRRLKAARPALRIEIVGSVARRSAAAALGTVIERRPDLQPDYARFREEMRAWRWTVGLAPLVTDPFNAAKTPIKWTEYAAAGIPVIASRTEPYLALGRSGALLLASPDEWEGRIAALLDHPARRDALRDASNRLLHGFDGWRRTERRLLGLIERAATRRMLAKAA